eukprot:3208715-Pyramimonas_sp.AAC.1
MDAAANCSGGGSESGSDVERGERREATQPPQVCHTKTVNDVETGECRREAAKRPQPCVRNLGALVEVYGGKRRETRQQCAQSLVVKHR